MFKGRNGARKFSFFGYCYSSYGDENDDDEDGCLFKFLLLLFGQRLSILKERTKKIQLKKVKKFNCFFLLASSSSYFHIEI